VFHYGGMTIKNLIADLNAHTSGISRSAKLVTILTSVGFSCMVLFRIQSYLYSHKLIFLAYQLHRYNLAVHGADFMPGCKLGPGFRVEHPSGIVIGAGVVVGSNCTIMQGVTLGARDSKSSNLENKFPCLGDDIKVGANSSILGDVYVSSHSTIGAHSLVLKDVEPNSTLKGLWK
jgi:serine O-acetyltransferase